VITNEIFCVGFHIRLFRVSEITLWVALPV